MIWLVRVYLFLMSFVYVLIGGWAILDPLASALDLGWPSFMDAIGLSVKSEIGYSEIAGIYGGLNLCIGLMCVWLAFLKKILVFFLSKL